jgi:translation initiation factor eIF-2B subunit epsilon
VLSNYTCVGYFFSLILLVLWIFLYSLVNEIQYHLTLILHILSSLDVILSCSAQISAYSVVGSATNIGDQCKILNSVIGVGCKIGKNVVINGSYIWDNVIIEDGCKVSYSLICDGVNLRAGAIVEPGSILSFKVC